jgi:DNA replication protein DnaC
MNSSDSDKQQLCAYCGGSGWERISGAEMVKHCRCLEGRRVERMLRQARIPARYERCDLETYNANNSSQTKAKQVVARFVDKYPVVDTGLLFLGSCGVGKTHLAVSLLKRIIVEKGGYGLFYDFRDLLREIQGSWNAVSQSSEVEILAPVLQADVLVLDELGSNKPTDWVRETVAYVINCRYNDQKLTVFTSNYLDSPAAEGGGEQGRARLREESLTDRIGVRLRSRLYEMCKVVEIQGEDFRKEIRQATYRF